MRGSHVMKEICLGLPKSSKSHVALGQIVAPTVAGHHSRPTARPYVQTCSKLIETDTTWHNFNGWVKVHCGREHNIQYHISAMSIFVSYIIGPYIWFLTWPIRPEAGTVGAKVCTTNPTWRPLSISFPRVIRRWVTPFQVTKLNQSGPMAKQSTLCEHKIKIDQDGWPRRRNTFHFSLRSSQSLLRYVPTCKVALLLGEHIFNLERRETRAVGCCDVMCLICKDTDLKKAPIAYIVWYRQNSKRNKIFGNSLIMFNMFNEQPTMGHGKLMQTDFQPFQVTGIKLGQGTWEFHAGRCATYLPRSEGPESVRCRSLRSEPQKKKLRSSQKCTLMLLKEAWRLQMTTAHESVCHSSSWKGQCCQCGGFLIEKYGIQ